MTVSTLVSPVTGEDFIVSSLRIPPGHSDIDFFMSLAFVFWTLTYVLIIYRGFKDKTCGMPMLPLCLNLSWELIFSVFGSPPFEPGSFFDVCAQPPLMRIFHLVWFVVDAVIFYLLIRYGKDEFDRFLPTAPRRLFYFVVPLCLLLSFLLVFISIYEWNDRTGIYSAYTQNVLISIFFVRMLFRRGDASGQSVGIAVSKSIGTINTFIFGGIVLRHEYGLTSDIFLSFAFMPYLKLCVVLILFFDMLYLVLLYRMMKRRLRLNPLTRKPLKGISMLSLLLLSVLLPAACDPMEKTVPVERTEDGVPVFPLVIERLPDLGVPRQTGMVVTLGDTVLVMGGHTTGFIPVSTAEYFSAGSWHQIPMLYLHDDGFSVLLPDGRVMAGGGHDKPFGVGGSLGVEVFDPVSCRFTPVGILNHRRSLASALAFPDGQVLVCGNWYEEDSIEIYEPGIGFSEAAPFQEGHSCPVLIPSDDGEILVFSSCDCFGNSSSGAVERLYGEPLYPDVLREWRPSGANGASSCSLGGGNYLLPIVSKKDSISSISPSWRILKVSGTDFSLLETDFPIPRQTPDGASINWYGTLLADKDTRMAYMPGIDDEARFHLLRLNYDPALVGAPAELSLFSTRESVGTVYSEMATALLPDGRIMLCGGIAGNNFEPQSSAFLLHTAALSPRPLRWLLPLVLVVASGGFSIFLLRRRRRVKQETSRESEADIRERTDLMTRIDHLMEREELFRRKDLHLADVARAIGTNTTYISACINGQWGGSFSDYITRYRVEYAKKLMKEHPDMLIETVLELSGFANESSFYRTFKACTGQTPSEWKNA